MAGFEGLFEGWYDQGGQVPTCGVLELLAGFCGFWEIGGVWGCFDTGLVGEGVY